jgi:salicylate hydroxylase
MDATGARRETLVTAIGQYEAAMLKSGFAAVRLSLRSARQATNGSVSRTAFRAMLRAIDTLPPLKRQFARALGSLQRPTRDTGSSDFLSARGPGPGRSDA